MGGVIQSTNVHAGRVSAAALMCPGRCPMLEVNCALKSKYRACLGECLFGLVRRGNVRVVIHASIELMAFYEVLEVFHGQVYR